MEDDAEDAEKEYDVLIRCTDGLEINFATRVSTSTNQSHVIGYLESEIPRGRCRPIRIRRKRLTTLPTRYHPPNSRNSTPATAHS
jgi:hypothetical protein